MQGTHFDILAHVLTMYMLPKPIYDDFGPSDISRFLYGRIQTPRTFTTFDWPDTTSTSLLNTPRVAVDYIDERAIISRAFVSAIYLDSNDYLWPIEVISAKNLMKAGAMLHRRGNLGGLIFVHPLQRRNGCIVITCKHDFDLFSPWFWEAIKTFDKDGVVPKGPLPKSATVVPINNEGSYTWTRTHMRLDKAIVDFIHAP